MSEEFVISEVKKLQYLYGLKREIRYAQKRNDDGLTESVAEHIYGMHILAIYFLPLENPTGDWEKSKVFSTITLHDIDEIETGDVLGFLKTEEMYSDELLAAKKVIVNIPESTKSVATEVLESFAKLDTIEARFVKALDRFEPLIQIFNEKHKKVLKEIKITADDSKRIKEPYLKEFPIMHEYYQIIHKKMEEERYFV